MEEERAETIHVGKRRSSLGALSKAKQVAKLKGMFEAKAAVTKPKDNDLLSKLKPISASIDFSQPNATEAFNFAGSHTISIPAPSEQLPTTPTQPLFRLLPLGQDGAPIPNPSPPLSAERASQSRCSTDGGGTDTKPPKSPGSGSFILRMGRSVGKSIKKVLTPRSSAQKQQDTGSEASNLSPCPSMPLNLVPSSLPSSTSMDLNVRSDQQQPQLGPSPRGYDAHGSQECAPEYPQEGVAGALPEMKASRSPNFLLRHSPSPHKSSSSILDGIASRIIATSPRGKPTVEVPAKSSTDNSPDQTPRRKGPDGVDPRAAPAPSASAEPFSEAATSDNNAEGEAEPNDASLTASPTLTHASSGSPHARQANMGADVVLMLANVAATEGVRGSLNFPSLAAHVGSPGPLAGPPPAYTVAPSTSAGGDSPCAGPGLVEAAGADHMVTLTFGVMPASAAASGTDVEMCEAPAMAEATATAEQATAHVADSSITDYLAAPPSSPGTVGAGACVPGYKMAMAPEVTGPAEPSSGSPAASGAASDSPVFSGAAQMTAYPEAKLPASPQKATPAEPEPAPVPTASSQFPLNNTEGGDVVMEVDGHTGADVSLEQQPSANVGPRSAAIGTASNSVDIGAAGFQELCASPCYAAPGDTPQDDAMDCDFAPATEAATAIPTATDQSDICDSTEQPPHAMPCTDSSGASGPGSPTPILEASIPGSDVEQMDIASAPIRLQEVPSAPIEPTAATLAMVNGADEPEGATVAVAASVNDQPPPALSETVVPVASSLPSRPNELEAAEAIVQEQPAFEPEAPSSQQLAATKEETPASAAGVVVDGETVEASPQPEEGLMAMLDVTPAAQLVDSGATIAEEANPSEAQPALAASDGEPHLALATSAEVTPEAAVAASPPRSAAVGQLPVAATAAVCCGATLPELAEETSEAATPEALSVSTAHGDVFEAPAKETASPVASASTSCGAVSQPPMMRPEPFTQEPVNSALDVDMADVEEQEAAMTPATEPADDGRVSGALEGSCVPSSADSAAAVPAATLEPTSPAEPAFASAPEPEASTFTHAPAVVMDQESSSQLQHEPCVYEAADEASEPKGRIDPQCAEADTEACTIEQPSAQAAELAAFEMAATESSAQLQEQQVCEVEEPLAPAPFSTFSPLEEDLQGAPQLQTAADHHDEAAMGGDAALSAIDAQAIGLVAEAQATVETSAAPADALISPSPAKQQAACNMDVDMCDASQATFDLDKPSNSSSEPAIEGVVASSPFGAETLDAAPPVAMENATALEVVSSATVDADSAERLGADSPAMVEGMAAVSNMAPNGTMAVEEATVAEEVHGGPVGTNTQAPTSASPATLEDSEIGVVGDKEQNPATAETTWVESNGMDGVQPVLFEPAPGPEKLGVGLEPPEQLEPSVPEQPLQPFDGCTTAAPTGYGSLDLGSLMPPDMEFAEAALEEQLPPAELLLPAEPLQPLSPGTASHEQSGSDHGVCAAQKDTVASAGSAGTSDPLDLPFNSLDDEATSSLAAAAAAAVAALASTAHAAHGAEADVQSPKRPDASVQDDPMMVSPMPQRLNLFPPQPEASAADGSSAAASASPESAFVGPHAFMLAGLDEQPSDPPFEELGAEQLLQAAEPPSSADAARMQDAAMEETEEFCLAADAAAAVEALTLAGQLRSAAEPAESHAVESGSNVGQSTVPEASAAPAPAAEYRVDTAMPDSIETMDAMFGGDDLLAGAGGDDGFDMLPPPMQAVSSPVSTGKTQDASGAGASARKPLTETLQSLDLFSLRTSCGRVSDSLMAESLDTFEGGIGVKNRALPFIPLAPLREAAEQEAEGSSLMGVARRLSGIGAGSASGSPALGVVGQGLPAAASPVPQSSPAVQPVQFPSLQSPASAASKGGAARSASGPGKTAGSVAKGVAPAAARAVATPSTALKALAVGSASSAASTGKTGAAKRSAPAAAAQPKAVTTPGQSAGRAPGSSGPSSTSVASRTTAATTTKAPGLSPLPSATPAANTLRMRTAALAGVTPSPIMQGRTGPSAAAGADQAAAEPAGTNLFDTPAILRAAAVPLADSPFPGPDFDLDTVDISAEASKALAMLNGGDAGDIVLAPAGAPKQQSTPVLVGPGRGAAAAVATSASTPSTQAVFNTHIQMLTDKLAAAEARNQQLQDDNAMLRDQLSTLQFERSMTNDLDMEREARQFLEQELTSVRQRSDTLDADLRAAHAEAKRRDQAVADLQAALLAKETQLQAALQAKEAAVAQLSAENEQRIKQMQTELEAARVFVQEADGRISKAESQAAAATAKCNEETARCQELSSTLGHQTHEVHQLRRARDESEAKFQKAMEQLINAQTAHKKQIFEYEQKIQQQNAICGQFNEFRERYRQMKQMCIECTQRAQEAEARVMEKTSALQKTEAEKTELIRMCSDLLTQLEEVKGKR